ncbi:MAG: hypothetical protein AB8G99_06075 [Planctomycetaceae bacterium]
MYCPAAAGFVLTAANSESVGQPIDRQTWLQLDLTNGHCFNRFTKKPLHATNKKNNSDFVSTENQEFEI